MWLKVKRAKYVRNWCSNVQIDSKLMQLKSIEKRCETIVSWVAVFVGIRCLVLFNLSGKLKIDTFNMTKRKAFPFSFSWIYIIHTHNRTQKWHEHGEDTSFRHLWHMGSGLTTIAIKRIHACDRLCVDINWYHAQAHCTMHIEQILQNLIPYLPSSSGAASESVDCTIDVHFGTWNSNTQQYLLHTNFGKMFYNFIIFIILGSRIRLTTLLTSESRKS